jgi:hypothetical protein
MCLQVYLLTNQNFVRTGRVNPLCLIVIMLRDLLRFELLVKCRRYFGGVRGNT